METTITARYRLTVDRMAEGLRVHARLHNRGWVARAYMLLTEIVSVGCLGYALWNVELDHWTAWLVLPMALFVIAMFAVINFAQSDRSHRVIAGFLLKKVPEGSKDVEWWFDDEGLEQRTPLSSSMFRWELVTQVVEVSTGFLLQRGRFAYDWIPGEAFDSPVDARLFAGLAGSHAAEYVLLGECRTADALPVDDR